MTTTVLDDLSFLLDSVEHQRDDRGRVQRAIDARLGAYRIAKKLDQLRVDLEDTLRDVKAKFGAKFKKLQDELDKSSN